MNAETLNNVNFQILLKQHNGNAERALRAWERICALGGFGNVPHTYEGGLDVQGIRIARDEEDHGGNPAFMRQSRMNYDGRLQIDLRSAPPPSADSIKQIEDIAVGDSPK